MPMRIIDASTETSRKYRATRRSNDAFMYGEDVFLSLEPSSIAYEGE